MRDSYHNLKVVAAVQAVATVTGSDNGEVIDTLGYQDVTFVIQAGASVTADANNRLDFVMQEGDLSNGTDMATVTDTDRILGSAELSDEQGADTVQKIGLVLQAKRYVRLRYVATVESPNTLDADFSAIAVLGSPLHAPTS